jgi:hypothetical protein
MKPITPIRRMIPTMIKNILINPLINPSIPPHVDGASIGMIDPVLSVVTPVDPPFTMIES